MRRTSSFHLVVLAVATGIGGTVSGCRRTTDLAGLPPPPPTRPDPVVTEPPAPSAVPRSAPPPEVVTVLERIDAARLRATVDRLAGFGTRHTLSDPDHPERGIGAARRYIEAEMRSHAVPREGAEPLRVEFDVHRVEPDGRRIDRPVDVVNVVATLPGTMPEAAHRHYYVVAHYDSRASDVMQPEADAPGANDDGSGTALVMELARVFAPLRLDATVVFMATAGEEQGLIGAGAHAKAARAANVDIRGVLNNDVVGDPTGPAGKVHREWIRVFSEDLPEPIDEQALAALRATGGVGDGPSRQLARYVHDIARWHALPVQPLVVLRRDRYLRGGDHIAFNREGYPSVRFTELEENYDRQHQDIGREGDREFGDLPEFVDAEYLRDVARLNAATLIHLANAPSTPADAHIAPRLGNTTHLAWSPSPEPDVAGYEVLWRNTTSAQWEAALDVGDVNEVELPLSQDNWFFGVRAYDRDGYRSPAAFCGLANR